MTKKDKKILAQDLIMQQISVIGYGNSYEEYVNEIGDEKEATAILKAQMDRIAKMFGYQQAWFS